MYYPNVPNAAPPSTPTLQPPQMAPMPQQPPRASYGWVGGAFLVVVTLVVAVIVALTLPASLASTRATTYPKPSISIDGGQQTLQVGSAVQLSVKVVAGRNLTYQWDFGDNTSATGASVTHSYNQYGNYNVSVMATDGVGQIAYATTTVNVLPPKPQATFTYQILSNYCDPASGGFGSCEVAFDASGSSGANIQSYTWTFGDGYDDSYGSSNETHDYYTSGTYTVTLVVTDASGQQSDPYTVHITV